MNPISQVELLLTSEIMALLIVGCYYDFKYLEVGNWLTGGIFLLSLPIIYWNRGSFNIIHALFLIMFFVLYFFNQLGGADLKVLVPLILIVSDPILFMTELAILGLLYGVIFWEKKIPYFIPITMALILIEYQQYMR